MAGTSGRRKFRPSSAPSFVLQVFYQGRKFRPVWPVLPVEAGTSGHPGRNFRCKWNSSPTARSESSTHINSFLLQRDKLLNHCKKNLPSFTTIRATSRTQDLQDLLPPPTKALDLWGFEGEDTDLHPHQSVLHFPLSCLRDLMLVFLFGSLVDLC